MPTLPKEIFNPVAGPKRELRRWKLDDPSDGGGDPSYLVTEGTIAQAELDKDDLIPKGQTLKEIEYEECQFSSGSEQDIGTSGNCTIYKILYTCTTVTEIWWVRAAGDVLVSRRGAPKWCVWKAVVVCPDGSWAVAPLEIWAETGNYNPGDDTHAGDPPAGAKPKKIYLPPRDIPIIVVAGQGYRDGKFLIEKDCFWEFVPPYTITGCWYTAMYKERVKIKKTDTTNNTSTVTFEDFVPETKETRTERIPGCIDDPADDHAQAPKPQDGR